MIYFDNSASSFFKPDCVIGAVTSSIKFLTANPGRSGHLASLKGAMLVQKTRDRLSSFLSLPPSGSVIFTPSCTGAINLALLGCAKKGHIVTTIFEHNAVLRTLYALKKCGLVSLSIARPNDEGMITDKEINSLIRNDTFLIAVNHVSNVTGAVADIKSIGALAKKRGITFFVDGAQSVGYLPLDISKCNIDMLSLAPHKGLHSIMGVGALLVSDKVALHPITYGGTGTSSRSLFQPDEMPDGFEAGTLPLPAIAGLCSAVTWTKSKQKSNYEKISRLSGYLKEGLKSVGCTVYSPESAMHGIVAFNLLDIPSEEVSNILSARYGICVRSGLHCAPLLHEYLGTINRGAVRVSLGCDNTEEEVKTLLSALKDISVGRAKQPN